MKQERLIIKLIFGLVMLLIINELVRALFDPSFFYGNETIEHKMLEYEQEPQKYNTALIGSSCLFWNIDPELFEDHQPLEWDIFMYNFGSGGTLPPETYYFLDNLLDRYSEHIDIVIIELRDVSLFPNHHRQTLRKRYFMSPRWYSFIIRSNLDTRIPAKERRNNIVQYGIALLERTFNIDYFNDIYGNPEEMKIKYRDRLVNLQENAVRGFLPGDPVKEIEKHKRFLQDTTHLTKMAGRYRNYKAKGDELMVNDVHLRKIMQIINRCNAAGIHCVFFMHPKQDLIHLRETIALAQHVPELHLIDISDPDLFPQLYLVENSLNNNHFNIQGTGILTTLAAQKFYDLHSRWLDENRAVRMN